VVGAGPAGVGAAVGLARRGVKPVVLIDRREDIGGIPSLYRTKAGAVPTFVLWSRGRVLFGEQYAERLTNSLLNSGVDVWLESQVIELSAGEKSVTVLNPVRGKVRITADAVVLACGAREQNRIERRLGTGARPAGVFFTKNMLDLAERNDLPFARKPVVLGSDLVAYAAAAKLKASGTDQIAMVDQRLRPGCSLPARIYFRRWVNPQFHGGTSVAYTHGERSVASLGLEDGSQLSCDRLLVSGDLIPNSELPLLAGMDVELPSRRLAVGLDHSLSAPGWFAAGNITGQSRGGEWCHLDGRRAAAHVARYLNGRRGA